MVYLQQSLRTRCRHYLYQHPLRRFFHPHRRRTRPPNRLMELQQRLRFNKPRPHRMPSNNKQQRKHRNRLASYGRLFYFCRWCLGGNVRMDSRGNRWRNTCTNCYFQPNNRYQRRRKYLYGYFHNSRRQRQLYHKRQSSNIHLCQRTNSLWY